MRSQLLGSGDRELETIDFTRLGTRHLAHGGRYWDGPASKVLSDPRYRRHSGRPLANSHCPCSRASIGELSTLMAHSRGRLAAFVVFVEPPGFGQSWTKTDLWSSAGLIPGVTRIIDHGSEAKLFGAATSGQTMVYDRRGRLLFNGGITAARGHFGDNPGVDSIRALIDIHVAAGLGRPVVHQDQAVQTAVFGCPLFAPSSNRKIEQGKCFK